MKTYNLRQLVITIAGTPVSGFGDGDALTITMNSDRYSKTVGADARDVTRSKLNDLSGEFKFMMLYTASANDLLQALVDADDAAPNGQTFPIEVTDLNGNFRSFAAECWVKKAPDNTFGREVGSVEWLIDAAEIQTRQGSSRDALVG